MRRSLLRWLSSTVAFFLGGFLPRLVFFRDWFFSAMGFFHGGFLPRLVSSAMGFFRDGFLPAMLGFFRRWNNQRRAAGARRKKKSCCKPEVYATNEILGVSEHIGIGFSILRLRTLAKT